jgi:hypothetical protein
VFECLSWTSTSAFFHSISKASLPSNLPYSVNPQLVLSSTYTLYLHSRHA